MNTWLGELYCTVLAPLLRYRLFEQCFRQREAKCIDSCYSALFYLHILLNNKRKNRGVTSRGAPDEVLSDGESGPVWALPSVPSNS